MKSFKVITWSIVLSSVLLFAFAFRAPKSEAMLRLDLKKGKIYDYNTNLSMEMSAGGQTLPMNMDMGYRMKVLESKKDEQTIACSYQRIKLDVPSMPAMSFDSDKPDPTSEIGKALQGLIGPEFKVVLTAEGKVKEIAGLKEIADKMKDVDAGTVNQYLDEETVRRQFEQAFNYLPNKMVGEGDTWQKEQGVPGQMPVKLLTTYKVKSITKDRVTVDFTSIVSPDNNIKAAPGLEEAEIKGDMKGTMELEKQTGFPLSSQGTMNIIAEKDGAEIIQMKGVSNVKGSVQ